VCPEDEDAPALLQLDRGGDAALGSVMVKRAELERMSIMRIRNWEQLSDSCAVGDSVTCPSYDGSATMCAGDQCCPALNPGDGSSTFICPSASPGFKDCGIKSKLRADCTGKDPTFSVPTPSPANVSPTLPPGWETGIDSESGNPYYFNRATGESSWGPPVAGLAPGWETAVDPESGKQYFYNPATGESTFDPPRAPVDPIPTFPGVPGVPDVPDVPDVPGVPGAPGVPSVPGVPGVSTPPGFTPPDGTGVPGVPGVPSVPGVPGVPGVPSVPGVLGVPGVPSVPGVPGVSTPPGFTPPDGTGVPGVPGVLDVPDVPGAPGAPEVGPIIPGAPRGLP